MTVAPPPDPQAAILAELQMIRKALVAIGRHFGVWPSLAPAAKAAGSRDQRGGVAPDREIDDQRYGDPLVKVCPRNWQGTDYRESRFSVCPPDFLDVLAELLDDFADGESDEKKKKYKRADAAKARGWARRKRAQEQAAAAPPPPEDFA